MTPEGRVARQIDNFLKDEIKNGAELHFWNVFGNGMQKRGVSDRVMCYRGYFVAVEIKAPRVGDPEVTDAQAIFLERIERAGGYSIVATDVQRVDGVLTLIDSRIEEINAWRSTHRKVQRNLKNGQ